MEDFDNPKFTSVRSKWNKYDYFSMIMADGNQVEFDEDKLLDHDIVDGILILMFENNHRQLHRTWVALDYALNAPQ
jgi:hypothetical protein